MHLNPVTDLASSLTLLLDYHCLLIFTACLCYWHQLGFLTIDLPSESVSRCLIVADFCLFLILILLMPWCPSFQLPPSIGIDISGVNILALLPFLSPANAQGCLDRNCAKSHPLHLRFCIQVCDSIIPKTLSPQQKNRSMRTVLTG